jgi:hypothetical protein
MTLLGLFNSVDTFTLNFQVPVLLQLSTLGPETQLEPYFLNSKSSSMIYSAVKVIRSCGINLERCPLMLLH